jgi:hypothetical protein
MTKKPKRAKKRNGRPSKFDELTFQDISQIRWLAAQGLTHHQLAESLGVDNRTLKRWRARNSYIALELNSAIMLGQHFYGSPAAPLALCLIEEVDRLRDTWIKKVGKAWGPHPPIQFHNWHETESLLEAMRLCADLKPPAHINAWNLLSELQQLHILFGSLHHLTAFLRDKNSWEHFSKKEPLRWDFLKSLHRQLEQSEKNSQSKDLDKTLSNLDKHEA